MDPRQQAITRDCWELRWLEPSSRLPPREPFAQRIFDDSRQRCAGLLREQLGVTQQLFVEVNGSTHPSEHTNCASICIDPGRAAASVWLARLSRSPRVASVAAQVDVLVEVRPPGSLTTSLRSTGTSTPEARIRTLDGGASRAIGQRRARTSVSIASERGYLVSVREGRNPAPREIELLVRIRRWSCPGRMFQPPGNRCLR